MKTRQLDDRTETYFDIVEGECLCGQPVHKVIHSNCTNRRDGTRYHYPGETSAWAIFRCKNCHRPINETFISPTSAVIISNGIEFELKPKNGRRGEETISCTKKKVKLKTKAKNMTAHIINIKTSWLTYTHKVASKEDLRLLKAVLNGVENHASDGILNKTKRRASRFRKPYYPSSSII